LAHCLLQASRSTIRTAASGPGDHLYLSVRRRPREKARDRRENPAEFVYHALAIGARPPDTLGRLKMHIRQGEELAESDPFHC
jgi:hypothetical protein